MADKQISGLPEATEVGTSDLFVLQQSNQAKKLTGQTLIAELADALAGHGGIYSITLTSTAGTARTYTITYADASTSEFTVYDGEKGDKGDQTYIHIRYATSYPVSEMLTAPNAWIGIYSGTSSTAPANSSQYTWYQWKGDKGDTGSGITSLVKTSTVANVDYYTITFSNGATQTFTVTNGSNIQSISKTGTDGLVDTYTVLLNNGNTSYFTVTNAKSISSVTLISGNHAAGTTDAYRISFNDGDTFEFTVYNGANGQGAVSTVAGIPVVGDSGNVPLVRVETSAPTSSTAGYVNQLYYETTNGVLYICVSIDGNTYDWRGAAVTVDSTLSSSSTNPVQNKVIYEALAGKVPTTRTVNSKALSNDITLDCSDIGAVPTSRTINGNALSNNVVTRLMFSNVSVGTSSWVSDSTYTDYDYKAVISLNDVTASMIPDVIFAPEEALSGNFAPVATSGAGSVTIYAKDVPSSAITIPTVICFA